MIADKKLTELMKTIGIEQTLREIELNLLNQHPKQFIKYWFIAYIFIPIGLKIKRIRL